MFQELLVFVLVLQSNVFCQHVQRSVFQVLKSKCKMFLSGYIQAPTLAPHPICQSCSSKTTLTSTEGLPLYVLDLVESWSLYQGH